jgi:two-component sensor histidine kinase
MRSPRIVQIQPGLAAMKFNTALLFLLVGASVTMWALRWIKASTVVAGAALLLSGLIVAQYPLGRSLGVDTLFHEPFLVRDGETPGRISPYTSGSFVAIAMAMLAARWSAGRGGALVLAVMLCAGVQLLACAQLVGYATGHRLPLAGGTSMALHTALGLLTAAWAVLGVNWASAMSGKRRELGLLLVAPVAASLFGVALALVVLSKLAGTVETGPNPPVLPIVTILAVAACITAAGLMAARVGFDRAATLRVANERLLEEIAHRERLESAQRLLVRELDHRVRNTLAQVLSLAENTAQTSPDVKQFNDMFGQRIRALSRAHSVLANSRWTDVDLRGFLGSVLEPFATGGEPRIRIEGEPVMIPARACTPLCMVYYELAANAARHGSLSRPGGWVELSWRRITNGTAQLEVLWRERGGPAVAPQTREGFGMSLIRTMIPHELGGKTTISFNPEGVQCLVSFDLPMPTARAALTAAAVKVPGRWEGMAAAC